MRIQKVSLNEWNEIADNAHLAVFNEKRPHTHNTFDYALLVTNDEDQMVCYATVLDFDSGSAYMQHGGAFPCFKGTVHVARGYHLIIAWLKEGYEQATTRILNTNRAMLKLADSAGFIINGCDVHETDIFLHLLNDFRADK